MALNFALSSAMNVGGRWIGAPEQAKFCSFNGYLTQVFVIQTDYWVFIIAIYTYFVLTDQKRCSSWIQSHPFVPWVLPWFLSVLWASLGLGLTGYGDIGAWCWFTSDEVRLLVGAVIHAGHSMWLTHHHSGQFCPTMYVSPAHQYPSRGNYPRYMTPI